MKDGKKEFLTMYRHLNLIAGNTLSVQSLGSLKYEFMSPPNRTAEALKEIISALVNDGFIDSELKLLQKGEDAIY